MNKKRNAIFIFLVFVIWFVVVIYFFENPNMWFLTTFLALVSLIIIIDNKWFILRDQSTALDKPYSFSRVQLAWWSCIIISILIGSVRALREFPVLDGTTLVLLGISGATTTGALAIDHSDNSNASLGSTRHQNQNSENILLDILSDANGVSIHRFQAVIFNIAYGVWFLNKALCAIPDHIIPLDKSTIMPIIDKTSLGLLGISSGTYAVIKTTENK